MNTLSFRQERHECPSVCFLEHLYGNTMKCYVCGNCLNQSNVLLCGQTEEEWKLLYCHSSAYLVRNEKEVSN
jgi:hypothetical protein